VSEPGDLDKAKRRQKASWQGGVPETVEQLVADFPALASSPDDLLDLIYTEALYREDRGERPSPEEYAARFPALAGELADLFAVHRVFNPPPAHGSALAATVPLRPSPAEAPLLPTFPDHEVLEVLGKGGMGVVYRARHRALGRLVAIKVLRGDGPASGEERERFLREARATAQLNHPNLVQLYEVGETAAGPYFVMELVEGGTLAARLAGAPLAARAAAELVLALAEAVQHAHERGIVHRDLKPANVLLGPAKPQAAEEGRFPSSAACGLAGPKIADFGLAKWLESGQGLTETDALLGTPSYMAPEQAAGRNREVGPAADVYALGAVLYECLTGRPPFLGATALDTAVQVVNDEPVAPRSLNPRLPVDLETVCLKCLYKAPARRYASAAELANDLRRFLDGQPVRARPTGALERAWKWARRRPAAATLVAVSLAAAAALLLVGLVYDARLVRKTEEAKRLEGQARRALADAEENRYRAWFRAAWQAYQDDDVPLARDHYLDRCPPEHRRWEWYLLRRLVGAEERTLTVSRAAVHALAFAPRGGAFATGSGDLYAVGAPAELYLHEPQGAGYRRRQPKGHHGAVTALAFSPDGRTLASASAAQRLERALAGKGTELEGEVILWGVVAGRKLKPLAGCCAVAFDGAGRLAWAGPDHAVRVREPGGKEVKLLPPHQGPVTALAFGRTGRLASLSVRAWREGPRPRVHSEVRAWDVKGRKQTWRLEREDEEWQALAFDPAGWRLALAGSDRIVRLLDAATGREKAALLGHRDSVTAVAFSPHGALLASASSDRTVRLWDGASGRELGVLRGHAAPVMAVAFEPGRPADDWRLASADRTGQVKWWGPTGAGYRPLRGHLALIRHVAFNPDGRSLASAAGDEVRVWDVATGATRRVLACDAQKIAFSPDGRWLATAEAGPQGPTGPGRVRLWPLPEGEPRLLYADPRHPVLGVAFSPDGGRLAVVSGRLGTTSPQAGKALVLRLPDGRVEGECSGDLGVAAAVAYSPDGSELAVAGWNGRVLVFGPTGGRPARALAEKGPSVTALACGPRGLLAVGDQSGEVRLFGPGGGELRRLRAAMGAVFGLAFTDGGDRLATASLNLRTGRGDVRLFDTASGDEMLTLPGMIAVAFSPDGRTLAAPAAAGLLAAPEVRLWHAPLGVGGEPGA
jgi:WD40 repeat protein